MSQGTPPGWPRLEQLFFELCDLAPEEQKRRLSELETQDPLLHGKLLELLHADRGEHQLLDDPGPTLSPLAAGAMQDPMLGVRLGAYRLSQRLGEGGMSTVYLAERVDGTFEGRFAIKVVRPGIDSEGVITRFGRERQILAELRHPSITRLLDGGMTPDGRPYLVMEFVDGQPIDQFCLQNALPFESILSLLIEIADALEHAHRRLVVHRDIKPGNILVTATGSPRLLDFGVAHLLDAGEAQATTLGGRFLTPEYASPEQIAGGAITTGIDVFSLGLLAYELLTGQHPFKRPQRSRQQVAQALCSDEPTPPSRVSGDRFPAYCRRDVDAILSKAMRKDPEARYASVGDMADDFRNMLDAKPVSARRGRLLYRSRRWLRRHWLLAASTLALSALATFGVHRVVQEKNRTEIERSRLEEVSQLFIRLLETSDPVRRETPVLNAENLVERARSLLNQEMQESPALRARFLLTVGRMTRNMGDLEGATSVFQEALDILEAEGGEENLQAELLFRLTELKIGTDLFTQAGEYLDRLRQIIRDPRFAPVNWNIRVKALEALLHDAQGNSEAAAEALQAALDQLDSAASPRTASWLLDLLARLDDAQTPAKALETALRSYQLAKAAFGQEHTLTVDRLETVALARWRARQTDEARRGLLEVLEYRRQNFGPLHPSIASVIHHLGALERSKLALEPARSWLEQALSVAEESLGRDSLHWAESALLLADVERMRGVPDRVLELAQEADAVMRQRLGDNYGQSFSADMLRLGALIALARYDEADQAFHETTFGRGSQADPERSSSVDLARLGVDCAIGLGDLKLATSRLADADRLLEGYSEKLRELLGIRLELTRARLLYLQGQSRRSGEALQALAEKVSRLDAKRGLLFLRVHLDLADWMWAAGQRSAAQKLAIESGARAVELLGSTSTLAARAELLALDPAEDDARELVLSRIAAGERSPYLQRALTSETSGNVDKGR